MVLPKESLVPLLKSLSKRIEVVAPVLIEGTPQFETWRGQELALGANPLISPLEYLLPKREVLFRYVQFSGRYTFHEMVVEPRVLFGVRPCDLKAVAVLDRILSCEPCDYAYAERRRSTVIVALNCTEPGDGCFCAQMGSGPGCDEGFDLLLTDLGTCYLVEAGSPAGVLLTREHPDFFQRAKAGHLEEKKRRMAAAKEQVLESQKTSPEDMKRSIAAADWEDLGRRCLRCGGCSFVCPICHCFNILDLGVPDGERIRCADSCILEGFSRMTSGANPRPTQGERLQNWYHDKFEYLPRRFGLVGCVGCGRCDRVCMAQIDRRKLEVI